MALEGLTLNGLSLNNGTTHMLTALQLPIPAKKPEWVEGADANGAVLMRDPLVENGTLVATVDLIGSTKAQALGLIGAIVDELEEADRNSAGVPVVWTPAGGGLSMTFYALSGEVTQLENDIKFTAGNVPTVVVTLKCRPGGYGALVTGPSQTTAGPVVQLTVPDVPGDMPTDEAYIVITDQSSQSRRHVEWGAEWLHYNASTSLILDSDSLVTSGYAGAQSTWGAGGAYDPNATGTNSVNATLYASAWTAILSTGPQSHVGTFRVKARVMCAPGAAYFRLSWQVGDGDRSVNDQAYAAGPSANGNFREIDLGLVTIPPVTAGTQAWDGVLEGKAADAYTVSPWNVDYLTLVPVEAGYGRARGQAAAQTGTVVATDGFAQSAGPLNAKTMTLGGAWASSGGATDFQVTGSGTATRTAVSETAWAGRFAIAGTTNYINVAPSLTMTAPLATNPAVGPVVRYVDASNWLAFLFSANTVYINSYETWLYVYICVAGTKTLLASQGAGVSGTPALTVSGDVNASGVYTATISTGTATRTVTGSHTALATGGALATGKTGFYSETRGTSGVQTFDSFTASTVPLAVPAIYSGRTLEVTGAETRRQDSAGTMYGRPASYRGSRFVLNPEGSAGRSTRILAKAWRNDVDLGAEATPVTDSLKCQVFYRARYSVVPR